MYTVSIRLMCYNQEKLIAKAMDGIMMQKTNFKVEVVIGDDFSSDNTLNIIKQYQNTDHIKINILNRTKGDEYWEMRQKHGRLYNYYNILHNCNGKYIAMLDGDDYWTDTRKLQKQVDFFEENPNCTINSHEVNTTKINVENGLKSGIGIVIDSFKFGKISYALRTTASIITNKTKFWESRVAHSKDTRFYHYKFQDILFNKHFMATSAMMIRSDVVKKIGLWYTGTDGGHYFIVLIALSLGTGYHFKDFMGLHNLHEGSISLDPGRKKEAKINGSENRIFRLKKLLEVAPMYSDLIMRKIDVEQEQQMNNF